MTSPNQEPPKTLEGRSVSFSFGPSFQVNRAFGAPSIGFDTTNTISLRDNRVGTDQSIAAGKEIGIADSMILLLRGAYDNVYPDTNKWDVSLFDLQTYTEIDLNTETTLTTPVFIEAKSSG